MKRRYWYISVVGLALLTCFMIGQDAEAKTYEANWESINSRPVPQWFEDAKFGIFIHWGLYAVPSWGPKDQYAEWYWRRLQNGTESFVTFHNEVYGEDFKYQDFVKDFKAEMYDPAQWADVFKRAGAKYVVLTSKHHEGFCLWPSPHSWNWNAVDVGPHRDLLGDLTEAVRDEGLKMGYYYSLYEWYNPFFRYDVDRYVDEHMIPQMKDLITSYKPDILWTDGEWDHPSETWRSTEFLAWLYNEGPNPEEIVVNDRWGKETRGVHGGFYTTEYGKVHGDSNPKYDHKWEECRGIGSSFGFNRNENLEDYSTAKDLVHILIEIVSKGGNLLLNIGPTADGRIPVIMQQRLLEIGEWLDVNGEAIYGCDRWRQITDGDMVRYTKQDDAVYAISLEWPGDTLVLSHPDVTEDTTVELLGYDNPLSWQVVENKLHIDVPQLSVDAVPCLHAFTFKLTNVK